MDETIPDERISEDRYGCYSVLFSNYNGLELEEIAGIFAQFAEFLGIRRAGNERGIHFVTFGTYEEAKYVVDALEDHPDVQLKVYRKNNYRRRRYFNDGYNNSNRWENGYDAQQSARRWRDGADACDAREEYVENGGEKFVDNRPVDNVYNAGWRESKPLENRDDGRYESSSWYKVESYLASFDEPAASSETVAATINTEGKQFTGGSTSDEESTTRVAVTLASEVIVGNVEPRTSEAYLLHLFREYEPIAVSPLLCYGRVHYCSVYFKCADDAERVERLFDEFRLDGRPLVVQRPNRLIARYLQQI